MTAAAVTDMPVSMMDHAGSGAGHLRLPSGWQDLYWFTLEPALPIDFEIGNWFTSTNPSSRFHKDFLAERLTPELRLSVFNAKVTERYSGGETRHSSGWMAEQ